jgi:hypothetical protein
MACSPLPRRSLGRIHRLLRVGGCQEDAVDRSLVLEIKKIAFVLTQAVKNEQEKTIRFSAHLVFFYEL